ncbi:MAG: AAA family ATPase, partial [Chloroflexota bacterium]
PYQLTENLEAYIRLKDSDTIIDYNLLSSGIRNFIFRLGHIYALYFNRQINRGFLFLDEPEQSLYPDFLYDIIERYLSVIHNTQMFVATHSEIVAAQFKPNERIRLYFDDDSAVSWRRGITPEGDDPNDVLRTDFAVRSLYGKEGLRQWNRFRELRRKILETDDPDKKIPLIDEYMKIGNAYNFAPNEIPDNAISS